MPPLPEGEDAHEHNRLGDHDGPKYPSRLRRDDPARLTSLSFLWETEPVGTTPCT